LLIVFSPGAAFSLPRDSLSSSFNQGRVLGSLDQRTRTLYPVAPLNALVEETYLANWFRPPLSVAMSHSQPEIPSSKRKVAKSPARQAPVNSKSGMY
jgi:hypothetical protein